MRLQNNQNALHLVEISPWPLTSALGFFTLLFGSINMWWGNGGNWVIFSIILLLLCAYNWWSDVNNESLSGSHNILVSNGLRFGFILFIVSEVMFFFSFFWAYFNACLGSDLVLGWVWPPVNFDNLVVDPFSIPLLNSVLLVSSGVYLTWSHHSLLSQNFNNCVVGLVGSILLGMVFIGIQLFEFANSELSINSSVWGGSFFLLTGFHGTHVIVGLIMLSVSLYRLFQNVFSNQHHVGFEASIWYWHFVDVVWLFLFCFVYFFGFY